MAQTMDEDALFKELFLQCEIADRLSDELCTKLEKLSETERLQLVSRTKDGVTPLFVSARRGVLDILNYLLVKCKADVNQVCTFYGGQNDELLEMTALMEAQNVDVARCLLEHGALEISMALRVHIVRERLQVADYLVSRGADVNQKPTNVTEDVHDSCLDYFDNDPQKYKLLLKYGANANVYNELQDTPLHTAVKEHKLWQIKQLLKYGANPKLKNGHGDDVLRITCRHFDEDIFQYLMTHVNYSDVTRANAYELMGAIYFTYKTPCSIVKLQDHWSAALRIRLKNSGQFLERELNEEKLFENVNEFRTVDELRGIISCSKSIFIQILFISHRILGFNDRFTFDAIYEVYSELHDDSEFEEAFQFLMRVIYLLVKSNGVVQSYTRESAIKAAIAILNVAQNDGIEHCNDVIEHFDDVLTVVDILWCQIVDPVVNVNVYNAILAMLDLLLKMAKSEDQQNTLETLVTRMVKKRHCNHNGRSLLHEVADIKESLCIESYRQISQNPQRKTWDVHKLSIVQLLLECGHCVDPLDRFGSTPLHLAVSNECDVEVVNCLLEHGAHIDRINAEGIPPCYLLGVVPGFDTFKYMTLKCLAAETIAYYGVPYKHLNFPALDEFIEMH